MIGQRLALSNEAYDLPVDEPLTLASYVGGVNIEAHLEHMAVGTALPEMPLYLRPDRYIEVPLESYLPSCISRHAAFLAQCAGRPATRGIVTGRQHGTSLPTFSLPSLGNLR